MKSLGMHLIASALPLDDTLGMPSAWRSSADWALILPTETCLEDVMAELLDLAMRKTDISFLERITLAPFLPMARGQAVEQAREQNLQRAYEAALAASGVDLTRPGERALACFESAGLRRLDTAKLAKVLRPVRRLSPERSNFFKIEGLRLPPVGQHLAAAGIPTATQLQAGPSLGWHLIVDLRTDEELDGREPTWPVRRVRLPIDAADRLNEETARRLQTLIGDEMGMVHGLLSAAGVGSGAGHAARPLRPWQIAGGSRGARRGPGYRRDGEPRPGR